MAPIPTHKTAYHKTDGAVSMHAIDAHHAVGAFPKEWSFEPWDGSEGANDPSGEPRAVVPTDWVDLKPSDKIKLARELGAKDIRSAAQADEFINGYLVERANVGAVEEPKKVEDPKKAEKTKFEV